MILSPESRALDMELAVRRPVYGGPVSDDLNRRQSPGRCGSLATRRIGRRGGVSVTTPGVTERDGFVRASSRDYRAFARCDAELGWRQVALAQTSAWLRSKGIDCDLSSDGITEVDDHRRVSVRSHRGGFEEGTRVTLDEENAQGHWTTTLTLVEGDKGGGWLSLEVASSHGLFVPRPRVAGILLAALPLRDGPSELRVGPQIIDEDGVPGLIELLVAGDRRDPVFLATTDDSLPFGPLAELIERVTIQTVGLGHTMVVTPPASVALNQQLGAEWMAPAWTVRTYLPGVDLASPGSARAHRILGTQRLLQDRERYLSTLLGTFARSIVASRPVPSPLAHWRKLFDRLDTRLAADALLRPVAPVRTATVPSTALPVQDTSAALNAELERVRQTLGLEDLSDVQLRALVDAALEPRIDPVSAAAASRRLDELQARVEALELDLDLTKEEVIDARLDALDFSEQFDSKDRMLARMGRELALVAGGGLAVAVETAIDELDVPESYEALVDRFGALEEVGVIVSADPGIVLELQDLDRDGLALGPAWSAIQALAGFVRARVDGVARGSVHQFLRDQPPGYRTFPITRHSYSETGTTMARFGDERDLPVPTSVDAGGSAIMRSHFKLARIARRDPRLYYLDDTARSMTVVVGYIGPHMTNTQT